MVNKLILLDSPLLLLESNVRSGAFVRAVIREDLHPGQCSALSPLVDTREAGGGDRGWESGVRDPLSTRGQLSAAYTPRSGQEKGCGGPLGNWMCGLGSAECQADHAVAGVEEGRSHGWRML